MLQDELDALKVKLNEQKQTGNLNIKMMTQEIVRMTEVIVSCLQLTFSKNFEAFRSYFWLITRITISGKRIISS